jgi:murein DD-endopeptidase MepM/ murein hydrolase activator NlpD
MKIIVGLFAAYLLFVPCTLLMLGGAAVSSTTDCATPVDEPPVSTASSSDLDAEQMANATRIVAAVRGYPATSNEPYAAVVAIATAMQESTLRNLDYGDRDSLGLFQQRPSQGWGTPEQVRDVEHATRSFLERLVLVAGWETMPLTQAAATVQRPAEEYAGLYARWEELAHDVVGMLWTQTPASATPTATTCTPDAVVPVGTSAVVYPMPPGLVSADNHNWGGQGSMWNSWHTGTDYSVPCGTPVLAATAGTVVIEQGPSWYGAFLIEVVTGPGALATWYAHMQSADVRPGQQVAAGQQIGEVGALGNASGCHLHFEVHLQNGDIYGSDNVDPSAWLAQHVGTAA